MCGILAAFGLANPGSDHTRQRILEMTKQQRHRGPDWSAIFIKEDIALAHERLAINDLSEQGDQPMQSPDGNLAWVVNGEIYNHTALRDRFSLSPKSSSDSAIVGPLYKKLGGGFVSELDGMFTTALVDFKAGSYFIARDHMGIIPLYVGYDDTDDTIYFSSEMKCIIDHCDRVDIFPPGHTYSGGSDEAGFKCWYTPVLSPWLAPGYVPTSALDLGKLRDTFIEVVTNQLMSDVPSGVLLSGGLDSSLVASVAMRHGLNKKTKKQWGEKLHSFSIGLEGSPDLAAAQKVADFIGTDHHSFTFTVQEGLDCLRDLIWHLETFEQVRASVPMYLLARKIRSLGIKVVLSGEGADELLGGYLYFAEAPNKEEFQAELVRKTTRLHQWDVLRANKSTQAFGLEARPPFLDRRFIDLALEIDPQHKMIRPNELDADGCPYIEKYALRKAFDDRENPYLPAEVLWRMKEQFSDGVGYGWVDGLRDYANDVVSDDDFAARKQRFPSNTPETKEYFLLRSIFESKFVDGRRAGDSALKTVPTGKSIACSTPEAIKWNPEWEKSAGDISGRAVKAHSANAMFKLEKDHVQTIIQG